MYYISQDNLGFHLIKCNYMNYCGDAAFILNLWNFFLLFSFPVQLSFLLYCEGILYFNNHRVFTCFYLCQIK